MRISNQKLVNIIVFYQWFRMFFERAKAESDDFATLIDGTKSDSLSDSVVVGAKYGR